MTRNGATRSVLLERLVRVALVIASAALAGIVLLTVANSFTRFVFGAPIHNSLEIVQFYLMTILVFLGLASTFLRDENIDAELIYQRLPKAIQREFDVIGKVLTALVILGIAYFGFVEGMYNFEIGERLGYSPLPNWWTKFLIPVGGALCLAVMLYQTRNVRRAARESDETLAPVEAGSGQRDA